MSFKQKNTEELLFLFSMNLATKKEFLYYYELISSKFIIFQRLKLIDAFFRNNYTLKLRDKVQRLCDDEVVLDYFDKKYLQTNTSEEMLEQFRQVLYQEQNSISDLMKGQLKLFINGKKLKQVNSELFFYLYIIKLIQKKVINVTTFKLGSVFNKKGIEEKLNELVIYGENKQLNYDFIQVDSFQYENGSEYSEYINLLQKIENKEPINNFIQTFKTFLSQYKNMHYLNKKKINMYLEIIGIYLFNAENKYDIIRNILLINEMNSEQKSVLVTWLFNKVIEGIIEYNALCQIKELDVDYYISFFFNKKQYSLISQLFLKALLTCENRQISQLQEIEQQFLCLRNEKRYINDIFLKYSLFVSLCLRQFQTFSNISKILFQKDASDFRILIVIYYLHISMKQYSLSEEDVLNHSTENNINIFKYFNKNQYNLFGEGSIKLQTENNILFHKEILYSCDNNYNIQKLIKNFESLNTNEISIIFYQFTKWINNEIINNILFLVNKNGLFELNAIYIIDERLDKYILLFDKFSKGWVDFCNYKNMKGINIKELYLVYFKELKENSFDNSFFDDISDTHINSNKLFDIHGNHLKDNIYWRSLECLVERKPTFVERNYHFFKNIFGIDFNEIKDKIQYSNYNIQPNEINIDILNKQQNELKEEMLTEQMEFIFFTNNINFEESKYLSDWTNELLHKHNFENFNCKLRYYYAIFLLCKKYETFKKTILDVFQSIDNRCLNYHNMKLLFREIKYNKNNLSQLLEKVKHNNTSQDKLYYTYIKIIIFIDHLLNDAKDFHNIEEDKVITQLKELLNDNIIISDLIDTNLSLNLLEKFSKKMLNKNSHLYYICFVTILEELNICKSLQQNQRYEFMKIFIQNILEYQNFFENFVAKYLDSFPELFSQIIKMKDFDLGADIIMFIIKYFYQKQKNEIFDLFYPKVEKILKDNFEESNHQLFQYAIVALFYTFKCNCITKENELYKKIKTNNSDKYLPILIHMVMNGSLNKTNVISYEEEINNVKLEFDKMNKYNYSDIDKLINNNKHPQIKEHTPIILMFQSEEFIADINEKSGKEKYLSKLKQTFNMFGCCYEISGVFIFEKQELKIKVIYNNRYKGLWKKVIENLFEFTIVEKKFKYENNKQSSDNFEDIPGKLEIKIIYLRRDSKDMKIYFDKDIETLINKRNINCKHNKFQYKSLFYWFYDDKTNKI